VEFAGGKVKLITTKEAWDQYLEEARRDGKIVSFPFFLLCTRTVTFKTYFYFAVLFG